MEIPLEWIAPGVEVLEELRDLLHTTNLLAADINDALDRIDRQLPDDLLIDAKRALEGLTLLVEDVRAVVHRELEVSGPPQAR